MEALEEGFVVFEEGLEQQPGGVIQDEAYGKVEEVKVEDGVEYGGFIAFYGGDEHHGFEE